MVWRYMSLQIVQRSMSTSIFEYIAFIVCEILVNLSNFLISESSPPELQEHLILVNSEPN